ncbi:MAG: RimK domain protein ATP-grasp [Parcubacteria group bacterium GW2011_GWA2_44_13]|nr:MAG: RimK domain protein ATP-grasp [Parcubacteria group bacterium GW2011_GWA2_44_13]
MKNILIIAGLGERYYFEPFLQACTGKKIRIGVFDPDCFPSDLSIHVTMDNGGKIAGSMDVLEYYSGEFKKIRLSISDINGAWYLRENTIHPKKKDVSVEDKFCANESRGAVRSLLSSLECRWVNRKDVVDFLASNKFFQQKIAGQCGLSVPRTAISNDPKCLEQFSDPQDGLLLKPIGYMKLDKAGKKCLYSQRFSHKELVGSPSSIRRCPVFSQEYVKKRCEHRVMVIGEKILSCRIDSQASEKTMIDWRHYDFERVMHEQVVLPLVIQQKLLRFMEEIELRYGAIDMIETPDGDFVFLEVNPSGQWGWIADLAGLPIKEVVAEMLVNL